MPAERLTTDPMIRGDGMALAVVRFCRILRQYNIKLAADCAQTALRALDEIDISNRQDFRNALLISLLSRPEDRALFVYLFNLFWLVAAAPAPTRAHDGLPGRPLDRASLKRRLGRGDDEKQNSGTQGIVRQSLGVAREDLDEVDEELLGATAALGGIGNSPEVASGQAQQAEFDRLARNLTPLLATRRSRRRVRDRLGNLPDPRGTLRGSLRYGGIPVDFRWTRRRISRTRIVVFCDVSRSMNEYTSFFLQFASAVLRRPWRMEVFLFASELVRVTRVWSYRTLADLKRFLPECGGGTQIGNCLNAFLRQYGESLLGKGTIVLILSDGLDAGDPAFVESAMERLYRRSQAVIWLNPLLHMDGYEPRAAGMTAALKYVDLFAPVHDISSLERLVQHIRDFTRRGRGAFRGRTQGWKPDAIKSAIAATDTPGVNPLRQHNLESGARFG